MKLHYYPTEGSAHSRMVAMKGTENDCLGSIDEKNQLVGWMHGLPSTTDCFTSSLRKPRSFNCSIIAIIAVL